MKKTVKLALVLASTFLTAASAGAFAGGPDSQPGLPYMSNSSDAQPGVGFMNSTPDSQPGAGNMGGNFSIPVDPNSLANSSSGSMGASYPGGMGGGYPMPMIDLRQVVQQGIRRLPQQQRYNGATSMANQNLAMLNQSMGSSMSPISQIRNSVRDSIMMNRVNEISRMGQATFRPMIQPGAVQSMISQIQPWNFPYRFQSAMMPAMIPMVSAPIKQNQMAYMQAGILNNPYFPNVPLPMPIFGSSGGGYYDPYGGGMPGGQGMYNGGGMMPGNQGMYGYSNGGMMPGYQGMMPMQGAMMPNMQNMMMQNMMQQGMMPMQGYGY